ncbi:RagB/SusD family nutrient uptake outer membrane protein [Chitinophaga sp. Mgbs1]|uniref:RagB/SusD family nutrient uptake outer membrane protein n=2 Tax=Chitinophaga solisilvae TaxID=1233460 RepID=A0A3S1AY50_9BACT|nr:RagB/SusD family nutrient uptake outer membrane protein [Chitinophaga solisilvae]
MKKFISTYLAGVMMALAFTSCSLDRKPFSAVEDDGMLKDPSKWSAATGGNYAMLKEANFTRNYVQIGEFPSDDIVFVKTSTDNLFFSYNYVHIPAQANVYQLWTMGYKAINGCNRLLEAMEAGKSPATDQLIGENLFIRAFVHFSMVKIFGRPYPQQASTNLGIPVVTKANAPVPPKRNTVREVYDQVIADLKRAKDLMNNDNTNSYATSSAAKALLARVYLYREQNDSAYIYADSVINYGMISSRVKLKLLPGDALPGYFTKNNESNEETIFAIRHTLQDDRDWASLGSMFYTSPGGMGYGEVYASEPYRELLDKYPQDIRHAFIQAAGYMKKTNGEDSIGPNGKKVVIKAGRDTATWADKWYILKYSNQEGVPTLSSPVVLRLAEMYLIRAEASAKMGKMDAAIADVNIIRQRAGLSGSALFSTTDLKGYPSVLDVVLDERRLELAFEAQRSFDLFRNNRSVIRNYKGVHPPNQVIRATDEKVLHYIPEQDILLNPNLVQNPIQ